jgi:hypothetical protein
VSDLKVNSADLVATGDALRYLAGELRDAEHIVQDNRGAIGHDQLAHQLDDMQGKWDDRRNQLVEKIKSVADVAKKAGETFEDIEEHLVAALEGHEK